jgi:hypothetical protein
MTTFLAQAQKEPILPFKATVPHDDYNDATLSIERYEVGEGRGTTGHWTKVKEKAIFCSVSDKEYLIRTIIEFEDVSSEEHMDLDSTK